MSTWKPKRVYSERSKQRRRKEQLKYLVDSPSVTESSNVPIETSVVVNRVSRSTLNKFSTTTLNQYSNHERNNSPVWEDEQVDSSLNLELRRWVSSHNVTHVAVRDLLKVLRDNFPQLNLPRDPRTLMQTPYNVVVQKVSNGSFVYFDIKKIIELKKCLGLENIEKGISLSVGIDGIPISRSNNNQFWPILGLIDQSSNKLPFVIGIWFGKSKPSSTDFLNQFIEDCKFLEDNGIQYNGDLISFNVSKVLADAPARSFIKAVKNHNSYFGCERCNVEGEWMGRVVYSEEKGALRTDDSFRACLHEEHHTGVSKFLKLNIGMVSQFPLDYLHLVCLGVTRKLLRVWVKGKVPHKLRARDIDLISNTLISFVQYFPRDFQRKPRSLKEIDHFKGTEFRTLLLYTGFPAFESVLTRDQLKLFLLLHAGIFILLSKFCADSNWNNFARELLTRFVKKASEMYGHEFVTYNVHSLIHLPDDAVVHGDLELCSTFKFESFMQTLKRMLHSHSFFLEQVAKRIVENSLLNFLDNTNCEAVTVLSVKQGDNCFMLKDSKIVVLIKRLSIIENTFECLEYSKKCSVPLYPFDSSILGIFVVDGPIKTTRTVCVVDILCKYVRFPFRNSFICIPLLHTTK